MSIHIHPGKNPEDFVVAARDRRILFVSDRKQQILPEHVTFYDVHNFCLRTWAKLLSVAEYDMVVFRLTRVYPALQHAFYMHSHLQTHVFLEDQTTSGFLQLQIHTQYKIVLSNDCTHPVNTCSCLCDQIKLFTAEKSNLKFATFSRRVYLEFPFVEYKQPASKHSEYICIATDEDELPDCSRFIFVIIFARKSRLSSVADKMAKRLLDNSFVVSYMNANAVKIGNTSVPETSLHQFLLFIAKLIKEQLEGNNIFLNKVPVVSSTTEAGSIIEMPMLNVSGKCSVLSWQKKKQLADCAYKCLKRLHELSLINDDLIPNIEEIKSLPEIKLLLLQTYSTTDVFEIENLKAKFVLEKARVRHNDIKIQDGNVVVSEVDPYKLAVQDFKNKYSVQIDDLLSSDTRKENKVNMSEQERLVRVYRKIPCAMSSRAKVHQLYTFSGSKTGILCHPTFRMPCTVLNSAGKDVTVTPQYSTELTDDEAQLVSFYQIIFFSMHWSIYPSKKQTFTYYYYAVPVCTVNGTTEINWQYLENLYNNFLTASVFESQDFRNSLIWNPFSRTFLLYVDDCDHPIESPIYNTTICEYIEDRYRVSLQHKGGRMLFRALPLDVVLSQYKKTYKKKVRCSGLVVSKDPKLTNIDSETTLLRDQEQEEPAKADTKVILDSKEACFLTNVHVSIIEEYTQFVTNFNILETVLHAFEISSALGMDVPLSLVVEAITPEHANLYKNYERLEFLGDSVLKTVVTAISMISFETLGEIIARKDMAISNNSLCNRCEITGLYKNISLSGHHYKMLQAPIISKMSHFKEYFKAKEIFSSDNLNGYISAINTKEIGINIKTYADILEALVGVAMLTGGIEPAMDVIYQLGIVKNWFNGARHTLEDYYLKGSAVGIPYRGTLEFKYMGVLPPSGVSAIEELIGYKFNNPGNLERALVHPSFTPKVFVSDDFQLLELLGDAVLDLFIACRLYNEKKNKTPMDMHMAKYTYVNNHSFASIITKTELRDHLKIGLVGNTCSSKLSKAYSDVFEALAGAIFCDLHWNFDNFALVARGKLLEMMEKFRMAPGDIDPNVRERMNVELISKHDCKMKMEGVSN